MSKASRHTKHFGFLVALVAGLALLWAGAAPASAAVKWKIDALSNTTAQPGTEHEYMVQFKNVGDEIPSGEIDVTGTLPAGMTGVDSVLKENPFSPESPEFHCTAGDGSSPFASASDFKCVFPGPWNDIRAKVFLWRITVAVDPAATGILNPSFEVSGAGGEPASTLDPTIVAPQPPGFGLDAFDVAVTDNNGKTFTQAAGHPDEVITSFDLNTANNPTPLPLNAFPVEAIKDVVAQLPPGFVGNPTPVEQCTIGDLLNPGSSSILDFEPLCPSSSQVGTLAIRFNYGEVLGQVVYGPVPLFSMPAPPGVPARFGTHILGTPIMLDARLRPDGEYALAVDSRNIPNALGAAGTIVTFWGKPGAATHDDERACPAPGNDGWPFAGGPTCATHSNAAFLRNPTSCPESPDEGLSWSLHTDSWDHSGALQANGDPDPGDAAWSSRSIRSHETPGYPRSPEDPSTPWGDEIGTTGCGDVPVKGEVDAQPTSQNAETASGLNLTVAIPNPGLNNPDGIAVSDIKKTVVSLPEGVTINPSQGEGLGTCSPAQYASTKLSFHPDGTTGCPSNSKIGTVSVKTPLLEESLEGSVYVASSYDNPFNSLVALYIVLENAQRGVLLKLAGNVQPNERTGQLVTTVDNLPQLPFTSFSLKFREGVRSPLATPRTCGAYTTEAQFTPWSDESHTITSKSSFEITKGVGGAPCPSGSAPFHPQLQAGSLNNNALSFSPFTLRMIREDGEQEITNFSADLPKGLAAKLAGVPKCSEADLKATEHDAGINEITGSICPPASQVGRVTAGYGVGSLQTHATGKVFLAGPYHGTPVSIATVVPAVVGPYDLGTIVQRSAFRVDPETAEVHVDSKASDPIPHILKGIELHLRDIRVYMDRPNFTFNSTSCDKLEVGAFLSGSGLDFTTKADDPTVDVSNPFQAANCSLLPFKPKLAFKLRGGTHRGDFPALRATLKARPGDANLSKAVVTLPRSAFLEQAHIKTVCTRVEFNANNCPPGSIYGQVKATTPLLDQPLSGNVYLRSNGGERLLPDLVMAFRGEIDVNAVGFVDSVKGGGIRTAFQTIPDTPVTQLVLNMQGGKKGLFVNSRNLCLRPARAEVRFTGQNGKVAKLRPVMGNSCGKAGRKKGK